MAWEKRLTDIRMACHQLIVPDFDEPAELVSWMGAMQAQDYRMSKWAVGTRLTSATVGRIDEALAKGEIVRTHIMRPTWHYVAGRDLRWMQMLTGARVRKAIDGWVKASGLDIPEDLYAKCNDLIGKILSGKRSLTRSEIETELQRAGITTADDRVKRYILRAETEGIICSGGDRAGKPTYALLEEHVPAGTPLHREEALAQLAIRYFRSHSPATIKDFIWWSGLTATEAKQAVAAIGDRLIKEQYEEQEFLIFDSVRQVKNSPVVHFLPPFDEYLVSYKERATVIPAEHQPRAFNRWGTFYPVILVEGQIVGNWNKSVKGGEIKVETSFFDPQRKVGARILEEVEKRYRRFWT